jgi:hypothetical protein
MFLIIVFICHSLTLLPLPSQFLIICPNCFYVLNYEIISIHFRSTHLCLKLGVDTITCPNFENGQPLTMAIWANDEEWPCILLHVYKCNSIGHHVSKTLLTTRHIMLFYCKHAFYLNIVHVYMVSILKYNLAIYPSNMIGVWRNTILIFSVGVNVRHITLIECYHGIICEPKMGSMSMAMEKCYCPLLEVGPSGTKDWVHTS